MSNIQTIDESLNLLGDKVNAEACTKVLAESMRGVVAGKIEEETFTKVIKPGIETAWDITRQDHQDQIAENLAGLLGNANIPKTLEDKEILEIDVGERNEIDVSGKVVEENKEGHERGNDCPGRP